VRGRDDVWDVKVLPSGTRLMTERDTARLSTYADGAVTRTDFPSRRVWVSGETGLMSLAVDPNFAENRRIYTCSGWRKRPGHDIRVNAWKLGPGGDHVRLVRPLVTGLPTTSGRHGGCRLLIARSGALLVGTGDAAHGTNPRDLHSLGGKTLRLSRFTGRPWPGNPFRNARNRHQRYVFTYGHRNVQGLAQRPDGSLWSVEHGPDRNDEVNLLRRGADFGWNPVPGYNEQVPMTDTSLPGPQRRARWRSGFPTIATSGATWVRGKEWGRYQGTLAVAALKGSRVVFMKFDRRGRLQWTRSPQALRGGNRLRSVTQTPGHALLVTTSNSDGNDKVLRVTPRG
jgi:glucose/arabinose dehydrogenase